MSDEDGQAQPENPSETNAAPAQDNNQDARKNAITIPQRPQGFGPQYIDPGSWEFPESDPDNADDLTASQWTKIMNINKVLYGFNIRETEKDIVKARLPVFALREPPSSTNVTNPELMPEFEVCDASSISIKATATDLQRSLAINGFSAQSIQAALGGGAFGVSAGISASLKADTTEGRAKSGVDAEKEYFAAYNFPRARLFLDEYNLKLSPVAEKELRRLKESPSDAALRRFSARFGHVFVTAFQLGGQLQSSKFAKSILSTNEMEREDALKAAVGASFGAQYVSGSAGYSRESHRGSHQQEQRITDLSKLAWTARGGNTLLTANPPQWASTVASYKNWRVIEQETVLTLHELIGKFEEWEWVPELFESIAQQRLPAWPLNNIEAKPVWTGRIKLRLGDRKLAWSDLDTKTLVLAPPVTEGGPELEEPVFTVLNANGAETAEKPFLSAFPTDYPVFLVAGTDFSRLPERGHQISGIYVNEKGQLKPQDKLAHIHRFSFRLAGSNGPWRKHDAQPLQNLSTGDVVNIYCHSIGIGPYANIEQPPRLAKAVIYSPIDCKLGVVVDGLDYSGDIRDIICRYDYVHEPLGLSRTDKTAFERKGMLTAGDKVGKIRPLKTDDRSLYGDFLDLVAGGAGVEHPSFTRQPGTPSFTASLSVGAAGRTYPTIEASMTDSVGMASAGISAPTIGLGKAALESESYISWSPLVSRAEFTVIFI